MQNKFLFYLMGLLFISFNSFAKAQETFSGGQGIYPIIRLSDLKIDKSSGSKITFSFKVQNQTKNSINLNDVNIITEIGVPHQNTTEFSVSAFDYREILNAALSDERFTIRNHPQLIVPRQSLVVKVLVDCGEGQPSSGPCNLLKVSVVENPNPLTLPNFYIQTKIRNSRSTCDQ